jgi:hypothetical protein
MARDLILTPEYTTDPLTMPENGDADDALVVEALLQSLGDRAEMARTALVGQLLWSGDFRIAAGGTLTSFSGTIGAIAALVVADSLGVYRVGSATEKSFTQAEIEGGGGTLGALARWWYVYAYLQTDGTIDYAISLTPPDSSRRYKGSDPTRAYLGCFPTTAAGAPIAVQATRGRFVYRLSDLAGGATAVLAGGASSTYVDVNLAGFVPPHAITANLNAYLLPNAAASQFGGMAVRKNGALSSGTHSLSCGYGASAAAVDKPITVETDASQVVEYKVTTASGTDYPALYLDVLGWVE